MQLLCSNSCCHACARSADDRREKLRVIKDALIAAYEENRRLVVIEQFIATVITVDEFERRVNIQKQSSSSQGGLWTNQSPTFIDQIARSTVRAEIAKEVNVISFEDFRQRELPHILTELQLKAEDLGIDLSFTPPAPISENSDIG